MTFKKGHKPVKKTTQSPSPTIEEPSQKVDTKIVEIWTDLCSGGITQEEAREWLAPFVHEHNVNGETLQLLENTIDTL